MAYGVLTYYYVYNEHKFDQDHVRVCAHTHMGDNVRVWMSYTQEHSSAPGTKLKAPGIILHQYAWGSEYAWVTHYISTRNYITSTRAYMEAHSTITNLASDGRQ